MIELYTIAVIALLAAISPGPDFIVVAKYALACQRRNACMCSIGIGLGILVHTTYCILGLAVIISQSILLFNIIKYCGALYLMYLGIKSLFSKQGHLDTNNTHLAPTSHFKALQDGFLTNVLNPKCTLFMISVFTLVVKPHTAPMLEASYGAMIAIITATWFVFLSYGLTVKPIVNRIERIQHMVSKAIGVVLLIVGVAVLFESR